MPAARGSTRRILGRPLVWAGATLLVAVIAVLITHTGIDLLGLLVALVVLLLIERTLGDWIADNVGPVTTVVVFTGVAVLGVMYVSTAGGRGRVRRLFNAAEARGYHTAYFSIDDDTDAPLKDGDSGGVADRLSPSSNAPTPTAGSGPPAAPSPSVAPAPGPSTATAPGASTAAAASPIPTSGAAGVPVSDTRASSRPEEPKQAGGVRITRLSLSPDLAVVGQTIVFRADLASDGDGVLPEVEFSVDGRSIARVRPNDRGTALARWTTRVPGQYVVRVRLTQGLLGAATTSATLNVLPGKS